MSSLLQAWALPAALLAIVNVSATWYKVVSEHVPNPYLDEFFHVPQAQRYCNGDYTWDPKITTPPGLYLVSQMLQSILGCDTSSLRVVNAGAICLICPLAYTILRTLRSRASSVQRRPDGEKEALQEANTSDPTVLLDAHSALNISLFPPLFFFSALYYTDVISTLVVLLSYNIFLKSSISGRRYIGSLSLILNGLVALLFRQTNIFWVAVFPAGLAIVEALKSVELKPANSTQTDTINILKKSWNEGLIYDCPVQLASPSEYILFGLTIGLVISKKPIFIIKTVLPYITLLGLFAGFVAWNGGVVLGDKSAHTATIHIPQMLYFWPYIVFFSLPLILPTLLHPTLPLFPSALRRFCQNNLIGTPKTTTPGMVSAVLLILSGLAAVHYNTIVHPYTLADNRHYVFYVFRILRRHPAIKYIAVPLYYTCAWITIQTLAPNPEDETEMKRARQSITTNKESDRQPRYISFITVWIISTALSVVTAPLVEPRYFIIPFIIWRLHVPNLPLSNRSSGMASYDIRLALESFWLLIINALIGYNFLFRGFSWPSEPGNVQRFLW